MKRVQVSPGQFVTVSKAVLDKMRFALKATPFTAARVREIVAAEPRNAGTVLVGDDEGMRRKVAGLRASKSGKRADEPQ